MLYFIMKTEFLCCRKSRPFRRDPGEILAPGETICKRKEERPHICRFKAFLYRGGIFTHKTHKKPEKRRERGEKGNI